MKGQGGGWDATRNRSRPIRCCRAGGEEELKTIECQTPTHTREEVGTAREGEGGQSCWDSATLLFPLQDLAWMLSFYARVYFTYVPLLGLKGFLGLFLIVR